MIVDFFDLERFVTAQDSYDTYNTALQNVKNGSFQFDGMWCVFPYIQGLEQGSASQKHGIKSLLEAQAYLEHETLGKRLYEIMNALPIHGDVEDMFGKIDAMKLHSCLTLFDIVAPDGLFADVLDNFFNKEHCQTTLKIVSSELSWYKRDSAFKRNDIFEDPRALLEGIDGSKQLTYNNCVGTILDFLRQGETMRMLISRYLWDKFDFSIYRVNNVKNRIIQYMRSIFQKIADNNDDKALFNEMNDLYIHYEMAEDDKLLEIADAIDMFWKKHCDDAVVKLTVDTLVKDSLCKHNRGTWF